MLSRETPLLASDTQHNIELGISAGSSSIIICVCVRVSECVIVHLNVELCVSTVGAVWVADSGGAHHGDFLCSFNHD